MAAMLAALSRLEPSHARGSLTRPTIVLACTVNEECGFTGAREVASSIGTRWDRFFPRAPDAAIVAEPTQLHVVVAHQGVVRWRCHTVGRAAHTSRPDEGINAIYAMSRVVGAIERFHAHLTATAPMHPLCGRPSACVSTIQGGVGINTVPERASIEIDRRLGPHEQPERACSELKSYIVQHADIGGCQIAHDEPFMHSLGLADDANRSLAGQIADVVRAHGRASELIGVPYGTDAAAIAAAGVPTVVFGPGSIDQAHTADEYIETAELLRATDIFEQIASDGLR
jgi:acetylornithine deacetylase